MKKTELLFLKNSYLKEESAIITEVISKKSKTAVILNKTIFYPQGGGQPADQGIIEGINGSLKVFETSANNNLPLHSGKLTGKLNKGDKVKLKLNWERRYKNMQLHTAGHLLDEAVKELFPEIRGIQGCHGIANQNFVKFNGLIDATQKPFIAKKIKQLVKSGEKIKSRTVTTQTLTQENIVLPYALPKTKPLRLITIGDRYPVPDGGTQLQTTSELWPVTLTDFEYEEGLTIIHYQLLLPQNAGKKKKATYSGKKFYSELSAINAKFASASGSPANRHIFLGKKGLINNLSHKIPHLPTGEKAAAGKKLNELKQKINLGLSQKTSTDSQPTDWIDVTMPGKTPALGHLHPLTQAIEEITAIFEHLGFTRVRYPEVDYDHYVFKSLNMPPQHPARDDWETFFLDSPPNPQFGELVLTTHTSNGQVREMERVKTPPIRMLNIGKCYRRQQDITHTAMFHQFEGLVIDKGINIQHLKGTLDYFARKFYGPQAKSRIRPFMFKFTEPSFEVDFSCTHCKGQGCRFCKSGWHEVGGAGMVHPNVLKAGNIDPDLYTGFAFGWGIERVYTLKPGLALNDIRPLYGNNLQFLSQF